MENVQQFLKDSIKEAGITQDKVAERIGWTKQNVNYKLNHKNARFGSMLAIAEGIGLRIKFRPENFDYHQYIKTALDMEISYEDFEKLVNALEYDLVLDWSKPGDTAYTIKEDAQ